MAHIPAGPGHRQRPTVTGADEARYFLTEFSSRPAVVIVHHLAKGAGQEELNELCRDRE